MFLPKLPRNHHIIKDAIAQTGMARDELFLTSKVGLFPSSMEIPKDQAASIALHCVATGVRSRETTPFRRTRATQ